MLTLSKLVLFFHIHISSCSSVTADIRFTYVDTYPDEIPLIEINNPSDSLSEEKISSLLTYLQQEVGIVFYKHKCKSALNLLNLFKSVYSNWNREAFALNP